MKIKEDAFLAFHHVGLLTDDPLLAAARLKIAGYAASPAVFDPLQGATLQLCTASAGNPAIELITPDASNGSLKGLLRRRGDYMYHVCFEVGSIHAAVESLRVNPGESLAEVVGPRPAILFDMRLVAFYLMPGLGLVELLERAARSG